MKTADKSLEKIFGPLVIDMPAIKKIIAILSECGTAEISDGENIFESAEELESYHKGKTLQNLNLSCDRPYIRVHLAPAISMVRTGSSDTHGYGIFAKLVETIEPCQRSPKWVFKRLGLLPVFFSIAFLALSQQPWNTQKISYTVFAVAVGVFAWAWRVRFHRHAVIHIFDRSSIPGFFKRNADTLVVGLVCTIIGALLGPLATKLFP